MVEEDGRRGGARRRKKRGGRGGDGGGAGGEEAYQKPCRWCVVSGGEAGGSRWQRLKEEGEVVSPNHDFFLFIQFFLN